MITTVNNICKSSNSNLLPYINTIPEGYSVGYYKGQKYGITKETFTNGKSVKLYGEELGGTNFISLNYYITTNKDLLKPCEMPVQKVIHFLQNVQL